MKTLKQIIGKNENFNLEALLSNEFAIEPKDVVFTVYLGQKQRMITRNGYDDSVETGIFLSYVYHQLKKEGLSRDFTNQFKEIIKPYCECGIYRTLCLPISKEQEALPEYTHIVEKRRKSKPIKEKLSKLFEQITQSPEYSKSKQIFEKCWNYFGAYRNIDRDTVKKTQKVVVNKDIINILPTDNDVSFAGKVQHYIGDMLAFTHHAFTKNYHSITNSED